jgi:hypothetical protein
MSHERKTLEHDLDLAHDHKEAQQMLATARAKKNKALADCDQLI